MTSNVCDEIQEMSSLIAPQLVSTLLENGMNMIDLIFVGTLGKGNIAALAIGNSFFNISWFFIEGWISAQDSLSTLAYARGDTKGLRLWMYIAFATSTCWCILASASFFFAEFVLGEWLFITYHMKTKAAVHVYLLAPGLWFLAYYRIVSKYLQAQGETRQTVIASVIGAAVNILGNYIFIFTFGFGFSGCGLATSVARLCMLLYVLKTLRGRKNDWDDVEKEVGRSKGWAWFCKGLRSLGKRGGAKGEGGEGDAEEEEEGEGDDGEAIASGALAAGGGGRRRNANADEEEKGVEMSSLLLGDEKNGASKGSLDDEMDEVFLSDDKKKRKKKQQPQSDEKTSKDRLNARGKPGHGGVMKSFRAVIFKTIRFSSLAFWGGLSGGLGGGGGGGGLGGWGWAASDMIISQLGTVSLSAHAIMEMMTCFISQVVPASIAFASYTRVGLLLREQNHVGAKMSSTIAILCSCASMCVCAAVVWLFPILFGGFFTNDEDILYRLANNNFPILVAALQVGIGLQGGSRGTLLALSRSTEVLTFSFVCIWLLALPLGYYVCFYTYPPMGLEGLWLLLSIGVGSAAIIINLLVIGMSWEREMCRMFIRLQLAEEAAAGRGEEHTRALISSGHVRVPVSLEDVIEEEEAINIMMIEGVDVDQTEEQKVQEEEEEEEKS